MKKRWVLLASAFGALGMAALAQNKVSIEFWSWYLSPKFDPYLMGVINEFQ